MSKKKIKLSKNEEILRKDFYAFQKKVNRLEELRSELNKLDTSGFEREVSVIRSRLKDTTALPELERQIRILRKKILKKRDIKRKSPLKKIEHEVSEIGDVNSEIKKEIKNLKTSINEKYDKLEKKKKVDSEIGLSVDEGFQGFVNSIKLDLTEKLKDRERELNDQLKRDLAIRKKELDIKYKEMEDHLKKENEKRSQEYESKIKEYNLMEDDLKQKYKDKIKTDLKKEIERKFTSELNKKFEAERAKLDLYYVSRVKQRYKEEFEKHKKNLEDQFRIKVNAELRKLNQENEMSKNSAREQLNKKLLEYNKKKKEIERKKKILEKRLKSKLQTGDHIVQSKIEENNRILHEKMLELDREKRENEDLLKKKIEELNEQKQKSADHLRKKQEELRKQLAKEAHDKLVRELEIRRKQIDAESRKNFVIKMNNYLEEQRKKQQTEIDSRVRELKEALDHQQKVNEMLNQNISEKTYALEKQKEKNRELLLQQSRFKHQEAKKKLDDHKLLVEQHKRDIQRVSDRIKQEFHNKFDSEVRKHVILEKNRLQKEYDDKKKEMNQKLSILSFKERSNFKKRIKGEYESKLRRSIAMKVKELQDQLRKEYGRQTNESILLERKKFENQLKELETRHRAMEAQTRLREKRIMEDAKSKAIDLASERKKLKDKINLFKREEEDKMKMERIRLQKQFAEKAHQDMLQELKAREEAIKAKVQKEYNERMNATMRVQEEQLARKKAELARELEKKTKILLG